jgi:hypothetical protein
VVEDGYLQGFYFDFTHQQAELIYFVSFGSVIHKKQGSEVVFLCDEGVQSFD